MSDTAVIRKTTFCFEKSLNIYGDILAMTLYKRLATAAVILTLFISTTCFAAQLESAVEVGDEQKVVELIKDGANVNESDKLGKTALHVAALKGHRNIAKILLDNKADPQAADWNGYTPLHFAAKNGHQAIVELLLANGANVDARSSNTGMTPLLWAAWEGKNDVVMTLLKRNANANVVDNSGFAPLHRAAQFGYIDVVKTLVNGGANINLKEKYGRTPLDYANMQKRTEIADWLHARGAKKGAENAGASN